MKVGSAKKGLSLEPSTGATLLFTIDVARVDCHKVHIVFSKSIPHSQSSSAKSCFQARFCSSGAVRASNRSTPFFGGAPRHLTTHSAASSRFISPESPRECSSSALFCEKTTGFPPIPGLIVAGRTIVSGIFPARAAFVKVSSRSCPRRRFSSPPNKLPRKPPPSPADPTQMTCFTFPSRMAAFRMAPGAPQLIIARTPLRITYAISVSDSKSATSAAVTYGPNLMLAASGVRPIATTGCLATISCMIIASPRAVSASVTSVARRGWESHAVSTSVRVGTGAFRASSSSRLASEGWTERSSSGAPTLESWPYHLRSFGPPSITSSISSNKPFFFA